MGRTELINKVRSTIRRYEMTKPGDLVLVGVSGGPDSVALLHVLWVLSKELEILLHVGHLNHMLRGEAACEDAAYVRDLAGRLGVPVTIESRDVASVARRDRVSLELAARKVRYDFYRRTAGIVGASRVALGHHAGDQAETVLLRLVRGTGTTGLAGIPPVRRLVDGSDAGVIDDGTVDSADTVERAGHVARHVPTVIRPLIEVPREEIEAYCREHELGPRVDASNLAPVFTRNSVRHELIPFLERRYNPHVVRSIARTAELVREDDSFISCEVRRRMELVVLSESETRVVLRIERLLAEHPAIRRRLVREALALVGRGADGIEFEHVEMVLDLARSGSLGASASLPRGIRARKARGGPEARAGFEGRLGISKLIPRGELVLEIEARLGQGRDGEGRPVVHGACDTATAERVEPFERRLNVPGVTFIPELELVFEAEVLETGSGLDARGGVLKPAASGRPEGFEERFDLDELGTDLVVRTRRAGDRIVPFGMEGHKKLKELFIDEKVPRNIRDRVPVIVAGGEIIWVVGIRRSNIAKVGPSTRKTLRLVARFGLLG
ncbi:MAG: tRNA lysidine(34) synthetase TilS [Firmicutes bacterium]|nr:tRNA lysidine(34) synthetase TilS [Bacillota bacterium]MDH7495937.1 tRNA lysidine(34) synthetase TilS [Bacillota bacterium]